MTNALLSVGFSDICISLSVRHSCLVFGKHCSGQVVQRPEAPSGITVISHRLSSIAKTDVLADNVRNSTYPEQI